MPTWTRSASIPITNNLLVLERKLCIIHYIITLFCGDVTRLQVVRVVLMSAWTPVPCTSFNCANVVRIQSSHVWLWWKCW